MEVVKMWTVILLTTLAAGCGASSKSQPSIQGKWSITFEGTASETSQVALVKNDCSIGTITVTSITNLCFIADNGVGGADFG